MTCPPKLRRLRRPGLVLAGLAVACLCGCARVDGEYVLNPGGSGKLVLELSGVEVQPHLLDTDHGAFPASGNRDDLALFAAQRTLASYVQNVEAWRDVGYRLDEKDRLHFRATLYFDDLNHLVGDRGRSTRNSAFVPEIRIEGDRMSLDFAERPDTDPPPAAEPALDEARTAALSSLMRIRVNAALDQMERSLSPEDRFAMILRLPGTLVEEKGFPPAGDGAAATDGVVLRRDFAPAEWLRSLRGEAGEKQWRERLTPAALARTSVQWRLMSLLPRPSAAVSLAGAKPRFDYAAEVAEAKARPSEATKRFVAAMAEEMERTESMRRGFFRGRSSGGAATGPVLRLDAKRPLPVGVLSVNYQLNNAETWARLGNSGRNSRSTWSLSLAGAPIPSRSVAVDTVRLTRATDADGKSLLNGNLYASGYLSGAGSWPDRHGGENAVPSVHLSLALGELPLDRPKIGALEGRVVFNTYDALKDRDYGPITLAPGAEYASPDGKVKFARGDAKPGGKGLPPEPFTLTLQGDRERIDSVIIVDEQGVERGYEPESTSISGQTIEFKGRADRPLPETFTLRLRLREGHRQVVAPFALRDFDLRQPPALPDPAKDPDPNYVDDAGDVPPPAEKSPGIPRLAAKQPMPVAVFLAAYGSSGIDSPETARSLGLSVSPDEEGWQAQLVGSPLPARTFRLRNNVVITEATRPGGQSILPPSTTTYAQLLNNPDQRVRRRGNDPIRYPSVRFTLSNLAMTRDQTRIERLSGTVGCFTYAKLEEIDLGVVALAPGVNGPTRNWLVKQVGPSNIAIELDSLPDEIVGLAFRRPAEAPADALADTPAAPGPVEETELLPDWMHASFQFHKNRMLVEANFNGKLPARIRLAAVRRLGIREVTVPFLLRDVDLTQPHPLPDPAENAVAFLDDDEDRAGAAATVAETAAPLRTPRLAANRSLPMALLSSRFGISALPADQRTRLGLDNGDFRLGWTLQAYGAPLPARTFAVTDVQLAEFVLPDGTRVPMERQGLHADFVNNPYLSQPFQPGEPLRPPMAVLTFPPLALGRDQTRIRTATGTITCRVFAGIREYALGEGELELKEKASGVLRPREQAPPEAGPPPAAEPRGEWTLTDVETGRSHLTFVVPEPYDAIDSLQLYGPDRRRIVPRWVNSNRHNEGQTQIRLAFDESPPERVTAVLRVREGLRDVVVPFELANVDLLNPAPLPDPQADREGKFVDDEEDRAEVARQLREAREAEARDRERQREEARRRENPAPGGDVPAGQEEVF